MAPLLIAISGFKEESLAVTGKLFSCLLTVDVSGFNRLLATYFVYAASYTILSGNLSPVLLEQNVTGGSVLARYEYAGFSIF